MKTIRAGPYYGQINAGDTLNWRIYITSLQPTHFRTDTHSNWKAVLSVNLSGVMLAVEDGESDGGRITALEAQDMTGTMIQEAVNWCDAHNDPSTGNC